MFLAQSPKDLRGASIMDIERNLLKMSIQILNLHLGLLFKINLSSTGGEKWRANTPEDPAILNHGNTTITTYLLHTLNTEAAVEFINNEKF